MAKKRTSKAEWLERALEFLEAEGVNSVKIDRLAKSLGTSRSGFYWHFKDRQDLLVQMLEYWKHEYTDVITEGWFNRKDLPPAEEQILELIHSIDTFGLNRYEVPIRAWADHDPIAAAFVQEVYASRLIFVKGLISKNGFSGNELEMRARLLLCYLTNGIAMFGPCGRNKTKQLAQVCNDIVLNPIQ